MAESAPELVQVLGEIFFDGGRLMACRVLRAATDSWVFLSVFCRNQELLVGIIVRRTERIGCKWKMLVCGELGAGRLDGARNKNEERQLLAASSLLAGLRLHWGAEAAPKARGPKRTVECFSVSKDIAGGKAGRMDLQSGHPIGIRRGFAAWIVFRKKWGASVGDQSPTYQLGPDTRRRATASFRLRPPRRTALKMTIGGFEYGIPPKQSLDGGTPLRAGLSGKIGDCAIPPKQSLDGAHLFVWIEWEDWELCDPTQAELGWGTPVRAGLSGPFSCWIELEE